MVTVVSAHGLSNGARGSIGTCSATSCPTRSQLSRSALRHGIAPFLYQVFL